MTWPTQYIALVEQRPLMHNGLVSAHCVRRRYHHHHLLLKFMKISSRVFQIHSLLTQKISISYMHETILCPYRIRFDHIKQIPDQTSGVATRAMTNKDDLDKNNHTGVKTHKASSSDNPPPTPKKKSVKTHHNTAEKTRRGRNSTPLKKVAVSAVGLLKTTGPRKTNNNISHFTYQNLTRILTFPSDLLMCQQLQSILH